jgi:hypothetical protein
MTLGMILVAYAATLKGRPQRRLGRHAESGVGAEQLVWFVLQFVVAVADGGCCRAMMPARRLSLSR